MLKELLMINETFTEAMKENNSILGAWKFGSLSHGNFDEYSDIDMIFLVSEDGYPQIEKTVQQLLSKYCDEIVLMWGEDFNGQAMKNYDLLLRVNDKIFQYDIFLLNNSMLHDFMCQMHYTGLKPEDVVFEKEHCVSDLISTAPKGETWSGNYRRIIETYWLHIHMSKKYFARKDFFKLEEILRILMDNHTALLLTAYDALTWGGTANKLHYLQQEKQEHLMKYGCTGNWQQMKDHLEQAMQWFYEDVQDVCDEEDKTYNEKLSTEIMPFWKE